MRILVLAATMPELAWVTDDELLAVGIGPVEAGIATAARLANDPPDAILHVGIAGARRASGLQIGDVVLGTESRYSDLVAAVPTLITSGQPDLDLLARVATLLPAARQLPIATTAMVGGSRDCDVEAMEGFAVLRAAAEAGVPCVEVRAISNMIEETDRANWDVPAGLRAVADAGRTVVSGL
ncbi:MAG: hypothetical protein EXQ67_03615 [Thermoleophilia bacterium]|nr:hypothetical protein [Thermoleophilia bacterium]